MANWTPDPLGSFIQKQKSVHQLDMVWVGAADIETADLLL